MTRVLIIDDDPQLLRVLRISLGACGYEVATAEDGTTALATAVRDLPELVLLDLRLPDVDGIEVIRRLRDWSRAPIVVLTGRSDSADRANAMEAGADDYVTKPFGMEELLGRLRGAERPGLDATRGPGPARDSGDGTVTPPPQGRTDSHS